MTRKNVLRSLEMSFGKIPSSIRDNVKCLSYNDDENYFTCVPCVKIIKIASNNDNTTNNFVKHFYSNVHKKNNISTNDLLQRLSSTFYGKVPPIILMNAEKLGVNGTNYECAICDKIILVNNNTENNFSSHLLSIGHEKKIKKYNQVLSELFDIYGGISQTILNHSRFLRINGKHYLCTICDKQLMVHPTDVGETEKCFEKHLHSLKHTRNAKQAKTFSIIPELKIIFSVLPNYMIRNLEYISINGLNFFCSLCSENIKFNRQDSYETELNFKLHISSPSHEEKMDNRRDPNNKVFNRVCSLFEELPDIVQKNLKYLTQNQDDFYCGICQETINKYDEPEQTKESLVLHFESLSHENIISYEHQSAGEALENLNDLFRSIPELIQDNLQHIEFKTGNDFKCTLCNKILKFKFYGDFNDNTSVTERNFQKHLESNGHVAKLDKIEEIKNDILRKLEEMFDLIPQYIMNNLDHLSYDNNSDNYECFLCDKTIIAIVPGNKKAELTEQNFRNHFLSAGHLAKLKHEANLLMNATEELEFIFNKTPDFIVCNIQHIEVQDNHYYCTLCDAQIMRGEVVSTEQQFRQHLFGSRHRSNLKKLEIDNDEAFQQLDEEFWRIPEFVLRNIDFLETMDDNLYCLLCQEQLAIDEENLEETKLTLRNHIDSERHQFTFRNI